MAARFGTWSRWWTPLRSQRGALCAASVAATFSQPRMRETCAEGKKEVGPQAKDLRPYHLATWMSGGEGLVPEDKVNKVQNPIAARMPGFHLLSHRECVTGHIVQDDSKPDIRLAEVKDGVMRGGATKNIYWEPSNVKAAMVTCGGLCPGLNSVIREVTECLWYDYGVRDIRGMTGGYFGLSEPESNEPVVLNPKVVRELHFKGGSVLQAGRGGLDVGKICDNLEKEGINMVFLIGGDGTQFAGHLLFEEARRRKLPVSFVGIPKSIDNDILFIDKTFGFDSAVATASQVIRNAWVEASSCKNGVGIVKLMGRDAGFVAMNAANAATIADVVLIPEVKFKMEDLNNHIYATLQRKGHCVVVVAEGAGQDHVATGEKDATGHTIYGDIGLFLKSSVNAFLKDKGGRCFYIDPSYIIRSVPATPNDHLFCSRLAYNAVHTAMRGYSGVCVGPVHTKMVIIPSKLIASGKGKVEIRHTPWKHCVSATKMPRSLSGYAS